MPKQMTPKQPRAKRGQETENDTDQATQSQIEIPLDIALSLLTPDELAKHIKYVIAYHEQYST